MSSHHQLLLRTVLTSAAMIGITGCVALADDIQVPADPVAKAAFDVLDKACSRCHQDGRLVGIEKPKKNFGYILELNQLAGNPTYIIPGNPYGSRLFKQIVDKEMPYDVMYGGSSNYSPSAADMKALETWITSLKPYCDPAKVITNTDIVAFMASDLDRLPRARVNGTRYLTLTNLKNACVGDNALNVYRQGAIKLVNSLSRSSDVVRLETIDPDQTILRININDLGWSASDWDALLAIYPYNTQPDIKLTSIFKATTGTQIPYVRADWFAFYGAQPPLYNTLLKLGTSFQALTRDEGVDIDGDIKKLIVSRAGFQKSGVSANNRMVERHRSRSGYFWTSYDFKANEGVKNLFEHPLGPGGQSGFQQDGGETIFSLPNGFQGYYLNNAKGDKLDKGPTEIVRDPDRKDLAVTNGISCMGCHNVGMRKVKDDIRDLVLTGRTFSRDVRETVDVIYPPHDRMDGTVDDDAKRFADAMVRAGLDPGLKLNGVEMINALSKRYEGDVDAGLAAAAFGLTNDQYQRAIRDADKRFIPLLRRLDQATVPFDQFEGAFRDLSRDVTDDVVVDLGSAKRADVVAQATQSDVRPPSITLTSDKTEYQRNDGAIFSIVSSKDCFLTLTDVDETGLGIVLFPNKFQQDNKIKAGETVRLPGANAPFQYRMGAKGVGTVIAVCSDNPEVDGIKHNFASAEVTTIPNYTASVSRAVTTVSNCKRSVAARAANASAACRDVTAQQAAVPAKPPPKPASTPGTVLIAVSENARDSFRAAIKISVQ